MGLRNKKPTMDPHTEFVMPSLVSSDEEDADDVDQQAGENASEDSEPQPAAEPEAEGPAGGQPAAAAADRVIEDEEGQVQNNAPQNNAQLARHLCSRNQ